MAEKFLKTTSLILMFLIIFISLYYFQNQFKNVAYFVFSPFQKLSLKLKNNVELIIETVVEMKNLKRENENLKNQITKLIVENERLQEFKKENELLREALHLGPPKEFQFEMVRFLGKDMSEDVFLIDKGSKDGLKEGQVVVLPQMILVGQIMKIYPNFSKVKLFTFKDFSFDVEIGAEKIAALAKGEGGLKAKIEFIPKDKQISIGDFIFTSNLSGIFPKGILVGEIEEIKDSNDVVFKEAKVKNYFDKNDFEYFFVILNFK